MIAASGLAGPVDTTSDRPLARPHQNRVVQSVANPARFDAWVRAFQVRARARGIGKATLDRAFRDVRYRADVIEKDRNQSEFTKQLWEYLDGAVSDSRVRNGRSALRQHRLVLARIEKTYGVEGKVIAAIWGLESAYGATRGDIPLIDSLATLAFDGRRGRFFESQLVAALKILQAGDVSPRKMTGSWAGAMGHTQFIPTSYLAYAVDFTGDGKRNIWSNDPADALASTAAYLKRFGWTYGQPWGMEVRLPRGFNYALAGERIKKSPRQWNAMGVRLMTGGEIPDHGRSSILLPGGARGAAFVIFDNFHVIERYNAADAYVVAVGHLSDRIAGGPPIRAGWPRGDRPLRFSERKEMQRLLTSSGFDTKGVDGIVGPNTIQAVREFQASVGLVPDGYVSFDILRRLR